MLFSVKVFTGLTSACRLVSIANYTLRAKSSAWREKFPATRKPRAATTRPTFCGWPIGCTRLRSTCCAGCGSRIWPPEKVRRGFGAPRTLGELAAAEQVKPPTMSRIVVGLARSKLVAISADRQDARRMQIRPTRKGVKLLQQGRQRRITYLASHLQDLSAQELAKVAESTDILAELLQKWS